MSPPSNPKALTMKLIIPLLLLLLLPLAATADDVAGLKKQIVFAQKKLVVMENMELSKTEARQFWPLYDKLQGDLYLVNQRTGKLILAFASAYETLTDEMAENAIAEYLDIEKERLLLKEFYAKDFGKFLPAKKVLRYIQIENKLESIANFELAKELPLAQ